MTHSAVKSVLTGAALCSLGLVLVAWVLSWMLDLSHGLHVDPSIAAAASTWEHPLGTDHLGRDIFARMVLATQPLVFPAVAASCFALVGGTSLGLLGTLFPGVARVPVGLVFGVLQTIPRYVMALLVIAIYGNSVWMLAVVAGLAAIPTVGIAVQDQIERLHRADFIASVRIHGIPEWRIVLVHLLWEGSRHTIARHGLQVITFFVILEVSLSYLGFGVQQPTPSWGNVLAFDINTPDATAWAVAAPTLAIWLNIAALLWLQSTIRERSPHV